MGFDDNIREHVQTWADIVHDKTSVERLDGAERVTINGRCTTGADISLPIAAQLRKLLCNRRRLWIWCGVPKRKTRGGDVEDFIVDAVVAEAPAQAAQM